LGQSDMAILNLNAVKTSLNNVSLWISCQLNLNN
jgi:hypothetical protein